MATASARLNGSNCMRANGGTRPGWVVPGAAVGSQHSVSSIGKEIDSLFVIILIITGAVFVGTQLALVWALWRYGDAPGRVATYFHGSQRLEVIWTLLPGVVLAAIAIYQFSTWSAVKFKSNEPNVAPLAEVAGRQFQWSIRYPGPDGKLGTSDDLHLINDLHVVKNEKTLIRLVSKDVIHSFFLPQMRIKQDAVPGLKINVWFDADQAGKYDLVCAELCGWGHGRMRGVVTVHETRAELEEWLNGVAKEQSRDQVALAGDGR